VKAPTAHVPHTSQNLGADSMINKYFIPIAPVAPVQSTQTPVIVV